MSNELADQWDGSPPAEQLVVAYARGVFPMADVASGRVSWYRPDPRAVLPLAVVGDVVRDCEPCFRVSRSLRQRVRSGRFEVTTDCDFERVIRLCSRTGRAEQGCWLTDGLIGSYLDLHRRGHAHSVEAWLVEEGQRRLVGGLYGVHLGGLFAGESMVALPEAGGTDASKVCLVHLVDTLRRIGARVLDVQFTSENLARFGCVEVPADEYERAVTRAVMLPCQWPEPGALPAPEITR